MRNIFIAATLFLICSGFSNPSIPEEANGNLFIEINNIGRSNGYIWVGIYDSKDTYMIKEKAIVKRIPVYHKGRLKVKIPTLPYGTYAIALFHDINNNEELDRNFLGIPSEPYAFSGELNSKWRLPSFNEIKFRFYHSNQILRTRLSKWWD